MEDQDYQQLQQFSLEIPCEDKIQVVIEKVINTLINYEYDYFFENFADNRLITAEQKLDILNSTVSRFNNFVNDYWNKCPEIVINSYNYKGLLDYVLQQHIDTAADLPTDVIFQMRNNIIESDTIKSVQIELLKHELEDKVDRLKIMGKEPDKSDLFLVEFMSRICDRLDIKKITSGKKKSLYKPLAIFLAIVSKNPVTKANEKDFLQKFDLSTKHLANGSFYAYYNAAMNEYKGYKKNDTYTKKDLIPLLENLTLIEQQDWLNNLSSNDKKKFAEYIEYLRTYLEKII